MRLRHIEIVDAILRTGSLTGAAASLYISQPAASKLLANAEAHLGYKLFERVKGRLKPTRETAILTTQVARLQQELTNLRRLAYNLKHIQQGHMRVGSTPAIGLGLLPEAIRRAHETQTNITFDLHTHHSDELVSGLQSRELDLAITFDSTEHPGIRSIPVGHTELVLMSRERREGPVRLENLSVSKFIALDARDPSGIVLQRALNDQGIELDISTQVQTHYVACAMVGAGCGDTIVDLITAQAMLRPGLFANRLEPRLTVPVNAIVHASDPLSALHRRLIDILEAACSEHHMPSDQGYIAGDSCQASRRA